MIASRRDRRGIRIRARVPLIQAKVTSPSRSSLENPEYKAGRAASVPASSDAFTGTIAHAAIATVASEAATIAVQIGASPRGRGGRAPASAPHTSSRATSK